jgi:hypothetical protein
VGIAVFLAAGRSISTRDASIFQIADAIATTNDINHHQKKKLTGRKTDFTCHL